MLLFIKKFKKEIIFITIVILCIFTIVTSQPPKNFPDTPFNISVYEGDTVSKVADELFSKKIISSKTIFKISAIIFSKNKGVLTGDYRIIDRESTLSIAYRLANGLQKQPKIRVVIPEGTNVFDMAEIYQKQLTNFNAPRFVSLAKEYEGYLYPDTYYFLANAKSEEIVRTMRKNFDEKIKTIEKDINAFGKPLKEVIIMASLIEKEAYADESRKIIAGILWKRLKVNMPLQVDAPFYYITGKAGNFTNEDLKIDSPYNTYKNKGLPIGPISNPSLATILDTIKPIETSYWFYLTGKDGEMRYAATYDGHLNNKNIYLR